MSTIVDLSPSKGERELSAARLLRELRHARRARTEIRHASVLSVFFVVVLGANVFIGTMLMVKAFNSQATQTMENTRTGRVTFPTVDGVFCRQLLFDNKTFGTANSAFTVLGVPFTSSTTEKIPYFGTVRGRLGYAGWDRNLIYFTGGWAYGRETASSTVTGGGVTVTANGSQNFNSGWTLGGGWEWAFADRWSVKAEYLYIDFGNKSAGTVSTAIPGVGTLTVATNHLTDNVARVGLNYKFW